jgi:Tol biopolymer transport system component
MAQIRTPGRPLLLVAVVAAALVPVGGAGSAPEGPTTPGGRLAVVGGGGLFVVRARTGAKQLVDYAVVSAPAWSPSGSGLAYLANDALRTASLTSRHKHVLVRVGNELTAGPAWSPTGARLAFVQHTILGEEAKLVVVDPSGRHRRVLVRRVSPYQVPQWSPDGRWIAYLGDAADGAEPAVWLVRPNGLGRRIVRGGAVDYADGVSWSPDGKQIAFAGSGGDDGSAVIVANANGKGSRTATSARSQVDQASLGDVTWSPRSGQIAFLRLVADEYGLRSSSELWVSGGPGDAPRLLAKARYIDELAWSPDGRWIAYLAEDSYGPDGPVMSIRLVRPDGTGARRLTRLDGDASGLSWGPGAATRSR